MLIMAVIRATCPEHKDVEIERRDLTVNLDISGRTQDFYRYTCPVDKRPVIKYPGQNIIEFLIKNECEVVVFNSEIAQTDLDQHEAIVQSLGRMSTDDLIEFGRFDVAQFNEAFAAELQPEN